MGGGNEVEGNKKVIELSVIYRYRIDRETSAAVWERESRTEAAQAADLSKVLRYLWHVQFATSKVTSNVLLF